MRIAISGTHRVGKSTLVAELAAALPGYATVDEPYHAMTEDGHEFAHPPSREDFEAQLAYALAAVTDADGPTLFDRCPVDLLAYLLEHDDADGFDPDAWLPRIRAAVATLELVVFVPIEAPDRVGPDDDDDGWRRRVDARLRALLLDGDLGQDVAVLEVAGTLRQRARAVRARLPGAPWPT